MSPVLTREEAVAFGQRLLGKLSARANGVFLEQNVQAMTKVANGRILSATDGDSLSVRIDTRFGRGYGFVLGTNQRNDQLLDRFIAQAHTLELPKPPDAYPDDPDDPLHQRYVAQPVPEGALWYPATVDAMQGARADTAHRVVKQLVASKMTGAATVGVSARATLYIYREGLTAYARETDAELTVTARSTNDPASGWAGQARRDWTQMTPDVVTATAIDVATRSRNTVAFEPGRYTTILGPAAVAQLMRAMAQLFSAEEAALGRGPFAAARASNKRSRIGERVIDSRLSMYSDPDDPMGGYPAFIQEGGGYYGLPTYATQFIRNGVLVNLSEYGLVRGKPKSCSELPYSAHVTSNMPAVSIEEMIAGCPLGIYVNRFSNVSLVERDSALMTGVTRDGSFLIRHGKIDRPIKNFRFLDSPMFALNKVEAIGTPVRAAFGYSPPTGNELLWIVKSASWPPIHRSQQWPYAPMVVPPLMIKEFNFNSLADSM